MTPLEEEELVTEVPVPPVNETVLPSKIATTVPLGVNP